MTHKDIYTKFMIEYDKANVTSSYPSLTEYEVATVLDKAYLALIAQKITGNNVRRAPFEADKKAIEDLRPLIVDSTVAVQPQQDDPITNRATGTIPPDSLYLLQVILSYNTGTTTPMDGKKQRVLPAKQVSHDMAEKFFSTAYNLPWVKQPVYYLEDDKIYVVFDIMNKPAFGNTHIVYVKVPNKFAKESLIVGELERSRTYFQVLDINGNDITKNIPGYQFECNDSMAEELISLAISFALENVESQRLNTKLNMRGLEA